jgi:hypothetical protein
MRQQLKGFGLRGVQSLKMLTPSNYGFRKFKRNPSVTMAPVPPPNTDNINTSGRRTSGRGTPFTATGKVSSTYSDRMIRKAKKAKESMKRRYRDEFDSFVKSLISEVENVKEIVSGA